MNSLTKKDIRAAFPRTPWVCLAAQKGNIGRFGSRRVKVKVLRLDPRMPDFIERVRDVRVVRANLTYRTCARGIILFPFILFLILYFLFVKNTPDILDPSSKDAGFALTVCPDTP
jgi:hypothetical protein